MKISTKLLFAVFVPVLVAFIIGATQIFSYQAVEKAQENGDKVRLIRTGITELNHLAFTYITFREERPKQQFLEEHKKMIALLTGLRFQSPDQQQLLNEIRLSSQFMKEAFFKLVNNTEHLGPTGTDKLTKYAEGRLVSQLLVRSHNADSIASTLRNLVDADIRKTQTKTIPLIILVLSLTAIPVTIVLAQMRKRITADLTKLSKGTEIISSGNLDHVITVERNDEIGGLTQAFNRMAVNLKEVMSSRADLEREVVERQRAEEALRRSREWLQVTLISIGDAVITADTAGKITFLNPVAQALTGWQPNEALGQPIQTVFRIVNEKTLEPGEDIVLRVLQEGAVIALSNHTALITRAGQTIPIEDSAAPIKDREGNVTGVVLVFHDVSEKRRTREALRQHTLELQSLTETLEERVRERTAELANLSAELVSAQEKERKRISYDLHDNVWQSLLAIRFEIENLFSGQDKTDWGVLHKKSREVTADMLSAVGKIRSMQGDLWPYVLDDIGIVATLDWYCREFEKMHSGLTIERQVDLTETDVPDKVKLVIYRVMQETLNNAAQHSRATHIDLCLNKTDHRMGFTVKDNGIGFDPEEIMAKRSTWGGLGLLSIKARTELSGGFFEVESAKGEGTTVRASWPV